MKWDVKAVTPLADRCIYVELADRQRGVFDLKPYLNHGVFQELKDPACFKRVGIQLGAVT